MKTTFTLLATFCFTIFCCTTIAQNLDVDLLDIEGNEHNVQDYLDEGKPVFIYGFSNAWNSWHGYENYELHELYNTYGQGGSNELIVLMMADYGFDTADDLSGLDYSNGLGPGYENLSFTADNPIPIILSSAYPEFGLYEGFFFHTYCPEGETFFMLWNENELEEIMNKLYGNCCTALLTFDPALYDYNWNNIPHCVPTEVYFTFANQSAFDINSCTIDVYVDEEWVEQIEVTENIPGCTNTTMIYENDTLQPGSSVMFAVAEENDQLHNDTAHAHIATVDTVRGHIRGEIVFPLDLSYAAYLNTPGQWNTINNQSDFKYDLFFEDGCRLVNVSYPSMDTDMTGAHFRLFSLNDDGSMEHLIADTIGDNFSWTYIQSFNLYVTESVEQQAWGYVFEDVNDNQTLHPDVPRIPGIQVNHDIHTTFTDNEGFYSFPEITLNQPISIEYDQDIWPVYTTPGAGSLFSGNYVHNFGLRSDDPVWEISAFINTGIPYYCEWGMSQSIHVSNSGNQPVSGTVELVFDNQLTLSEVMPPNATVSGNTITWDVPELGYNQFANFVAIFDTLSADQLGELFFTTYHLTGYDTDGIEISSISETLSDTLFCAYDPNDKYGFPLGSGPEGLIAVNTPLKYRIRFQNTGNAPATNVTLVDTLPETLDWESFVPGPSSHDHQIQMNAETREIKWIFNGINLPDSASDPLGSIGYIYFDIEMSALNIGDQILNQAHIFFDQNEPISTNVSVHTIADLSTGIDEIGWSFEIYPNPANNAVLVQSNELVGHFIEIIDLNGRVLMQQYAQSNTTWIELGALNRGIYLISVTEPDSKTRKVKRLVKL